MSDSWPTDHEIAIAKVADGTTLIALNREGGYPEVLTEVFQHIIDEFYPGAELECAMMLTNSWETQIAAAEGEGFNLDSSISIVDGEVVITPPV